MESGGHLSLAAETIGHVGPIPITNTLLVTWITMFLLLAFAYISTRKVALVPTAKIQVFAELILDSAYTLTQDIAHSKAKVFFPFVMTFFLFIIVGNWLGLFPGFGTIGFYEVSHGHEVFVPLLRSVNADLNTTLALALVSVVTTHVFSIKFLGLLGYLKKWFSFNPVMLFVGLLELFSEFTKVVSLSFRLFGNIFAGEAVLATISTVFAFILPLPFYSLEIIVGFVQAAVFMMLTLVFMVLLTENHGSDEH